MRLLPDTSPSNNVGSASANEYLVRGRKALSHLQQGGGHQRQSFFLQRIYYYSIARVKEMRRWRERKGESK